MLGQALRSTTAEIILNELFRPNYYRDQEKFIVTMNHDVHEALVVPLNNGISHELAGAPLSRGTHSIFVETSPNAPVTCGENVFVPDLCVRVFSSTGPGKFTAQREFIFMETAFSQPEAEVMKKLATYVEHHPQALAIIKIRIKERQYRSPSQSIHSTLTKHFIGNPILREDQFRPTRGSALTFEAVRNGFSWVNVTGIEIELWLRLTDMPIDLKVKQSGHSQTAYAIGVSVYFYKSYF